MPIILNRKNSMEIAEKAAACGTSIGIFGTASHWNTEAILLAAQRIAEKYELESVPVVVSSTFTYEHMPQAERFLYCKNPKVGLLSNMAHLNALCGDKYSPYRNVLVLPHLDHADPIRDRWALMVGAQYFSSVMFDAQRFPYEENLEMTKEYVSAYGDDVLIEGIMEMLNVEGSSRAVQTDDYCQRAVEYVGATGIDFLVADLGTEQQSATSGSGTYYGQRARQLTESLKRKMLVLHGTSSLSEEQIRGLSDDGVLRVNMWTRIAREAGQYAAESIMKRNDQIQSGVFDAADSCRYIRDSVEKSAEIMMEMMELFGYGNWKN